MKTLHKASGKNFLTMAPNEDSSVTWSCFVEEYFPFTKDTEDKTSTYAAEGSLRISDCNKAVYINFDLYDTNEGARDEAEAKLKKLDTLISELNEFRHQLETAYDIKLDADYDAKVKE